MNQSELVLSIIKLVLGGFSAFLAIIVWSKTRDTAWMCLVAGTIIGYAGIVYDMMKSFGMFFSPGLLIAGMPLASFVFAALPSLFYIAAFILMIVRNRL